MNINACFRLQSVHNLYICSDIENTACLQVPLDPTLSLSENSKLIMMQDINEKFDAVGKSSDNSHFACGLLGILDFSRQLRLFIFVDNFSTVNSAFNIFKIETLSFFVSFASEFSNEYPFVFTTLASLPHYSSVLHADLVSLTLENYFFILKFVLIFY